MVTTNLAVSTKSYHNADEHSSFSLRGSIPDVGGVENGQGLFWVERGGVEIAHGEGLHFEYATLQNGDKVHAMFIDAGLNVGNIVTHTCVVSGTFTATTYVSNVDGSDTTGDGSSGNPWATLVKAMTEILAAWTNGDVHRLLLKRGETHATTGTGTASVLEMSAAATGMIFMDAYGVGADPILELIDGKSWVSGTFGPMAFTAANIDARGPGKTLKDNIMFHVVGATSTASNFAFYDCRFSAINSVAEVNGSADSIANRDTLDFTSFVRCIWDDYSGATAPTETPGFAFFGFAFGGRLLFWECQFLTSGSANHFVRGKGWEDFYFHECVWDRDTSTGTGNNCRLNGGGGTTSDDYCQNGAFYGCTIVNATEGWELDPLQQAGLEHFKNIEWNGCGADLSSSTGYFLNATGGGLSGAGSLQLNDIRARNCWWRCTAPVQMFVVSNADADEGTIDSFRIEHCTAVLDTDGGSYSPIGILLSCSGTTGVSDGAFTLLSNYGYCTQTGADGQYVVLFYVGSAAQVGTSNYNVVRKAGGTVRFASVGGSYLTRGEWITASSGKDANSQNESTGTSGLVSVTAPIDLRPSSSSSGPMSGNGGAPQCLIDADFNSYANPSDAGAWMFGGTPPTGPTFGGGGGSSEAVASPTALSMELACII